MLLVHWFVFPMRWMHPTPLWMKTDRCEFQRNGHPDKLPTLRKAVLHSIQLGRYRHQSQPHPGRIHTFTISAFIKGRIWWRYSSRGIFMSLWDLKYIEKENSMPYPKKYAAWTAHSAYHISRKFSFLFLPLYAPSIVLFDPLLVLACTNMLYPIGVCNIPADRFP